MGAVGDETVTRKKALIIAISEYDKANHLEDLPFCRNDGDEMINVLKSQGYEILDNHKLVGYVKYDVMWNAIHDFFDDSKITFNDVLLLYYSGHGFYYPGREKFTPDVCLGSSETNPDHPRRDGIPYNEIERLANSQSCSARSVVTILDCCYSGAAILGAKGENEGSKIITDVFDKQHSEGAGRCLLAASQQYEEAYTLVDQNHSIFTHYLLKGLRGDKNSVDYNGNVTAFTLGSYVFNTISSLDSKKRPKQKPVIKADTSGDIVLAEYPDLAKVIQEERSAQELEEFVDKKDFKNGFDYVEKLIKKYSDNSELWNYRGICCRNLKYYEMAIKSFEIGLMGDPTNSILRINCCLAYKDRAYTHGIKAEFEEALEYFEKSVSYLPNEKLLWNVKGELLAKLGIYEEALQSYEKALQIDPTYVDTWNNKGLILQNMRRYYDAIYCYDKVLKLNPSDETAWNNKGLISHDLENYKEAINCFDRVLVLNPYVKYVLLNKAETLHELGDYTGEEKCRERARKI